MRALCLRRNVNIVTRFFFGPCADSHGREAWNRPIADWEDCCVPLDPVPADCDPPVDPETPSEPVAGAPEGAPDVPATLLAVFSAAPADATPGSPEDVPPTCGVDGAAGT